MTKKFLTPSGSSPADLNLGAIILAGGTAGVAMWAIAIPPDVRFENHHAFILSILALCISTFFPIMPMNRSTHHFYFLLASHFMITN